MQELESHQACGERERPPATPCRLMSSPVDNGKLKVHLDPLADRNVRLVAHHGDAIGSGTVEQREASVCCLTERSVVSETSFKGM